MERMDTFVPFLSAKFPQVEGPEARALRNLRQYGAAGSKTVLDRQFSY